MKPQSMVDSDIRSLFAVLKLECHEKLRKESSESLVVLSNMEARLDDRLRAYKSMSVSEVRNTFLEWSFFAIIFFGNDIKDIVKSIDLNTTHGIKEMYIGH